MASNKTKQNTKKQKWFNMKNFYQIKIPWLVIQIYPNKCL